MERDSDRGKWREWEMGRKTVADRGKGGRQMWRRREKGERQGERLQSASPDGYNSLRWSELKPGSRNSIWVPPVGTGAQVLGSFSAAIPGTLGWSQIGCGAGATLTCTLISDAGVAGDSLIHCPTASVLLTH